MSRLVYGLRPVEELLGARRPVSVLYHVDGALSPPLAALLGKARGQGVSVVPRPRAEMDALVEGRLHQGVVAVTKDFAYCAPDDLLAEAERRGEPSLILALDGIQDPQNLGALLRTSYLLGIHGVLVPRDRAAQITSAVVKASAGASEHIRVAHCTNLVRELEGWKERGLWIVGASAHEGEPPWAIDWRSPTVLVLGSEGKGLRPLVLRACDRRAFIPMSGRLASFNVGAAGAMLLYEARRQRSI